MDKKKVFLIFGGLFLTGIFMGIVFVFFQSTNQLSDIPIINQLSEGKRDIDEKTWESVVQDKTRNSPTYFVEVSSSHSQVHNPKVENQTEWKTLLKELNLDKISQIREEGSAAEEVQVKSLLIAFTQKALDNPTTVNIENMSGHSYEIDFDYSSDTLYVFLYLDPEALTQASELENYLNQVVTSVFVMISANKSDARSESAFANYVEEKQSFVNRKLSVGVKYIKI